MEQRTCPVCREQFTPRSGNQRFCCKQHSKAYQNAKKRGTLDALLTRGEVGAAFDCAQCGRTCVPGENGVAHHARRFCGYDCKAEWHHVHTDGRAPKPSGPFCRVRKQSSRAWIEGSCPECGTRFIRRKKRGAVGYCSRACMRKPLKRRRRQRLRGTDAETVRLWEIGERDGWTCQLCGKPVSIETRFPHQQSATLDHIIPVALGGRHRQSNIQLAHMICNSRKGDGRAVPVGGQVTML